MVVFDNTFLTLVLHPTVKRPPKDPATGRVVDRVPERIELLLGMLEKDRETIIIPAPVLTEFLILLGDDAPRVLAQIDNDKNYRVESFDERAAIELAIMNREIRAKGGGRRGDQEGVYAKITFDRQIVAIAKAHNATAIYSDDDGLGTFAERNGLKVVRTWELPLPPEKHPLFRNETKGLSNEESSNGTRTEEIEPAAVEAAFSGVRQLPASSAEISLSPEAGSGAGEGETGKG
jgi:predicted nucleic acid-binding protein